MRRARISAACVILAGLVLAVAAAPTARADPAAARGHYEKGRSYFQVSEYRKAIEEFKAAHVEKPDPAYLYNIAECHRLLGEPKDALVFYRRFVALTPPGSPLEPDARKRIAELEAPAQTAPKAAPAATAPPAQTIPPVVPVMPIPSPPPRAPEPSRPAPVAPPPATAAPLPAAAPAAIIATPAPPPAEAKPVYKRGWFLVTVAAVVVAAAAGATWALTSRNSGNDIPQTTLGNRDIFRP